MGFAWPEHFLSRANMYAEFRTVCTIIRNNQMPDNERILESEKNFAKVLSACD